MINDALRPSIEAGVPSIEALRRVEASELFKSLELFSDSWTDANRALLAPYAGKWVADPLHQWSRRWEYTFVARALAGAHAKWVLDAGSGFTFFPYFLAASAGVESVVCVDYDDLSALYESSEIVPLASLVEFRRGDLRRMPVDDASVDAAYSISVLEHTSNFERVVAELRRALVPGGLLAITVDVALDGVSEIPPDTVEALIDELLCAFEPEDAPRGVAAAAARRDTLTTRRAAAVDRGLLPWRYPLLSLAKSAAKRRRLPRGWAKDLACYGGLFRRR